MKEPLPQMVELPAPRGLEPEEKALLDFMVEHPKAHPELHVQAQTARVIAECDCGCRSVALSTDESLPTAHYSADETPHTIDDQMALHASGRSASGRDVDVILFVFAGRLEELEIYDGVNGGVCKAELPQLGLLEYWELSSGL